MRIHRIHPICGQRVHSGGVVLKEDALFRRAYVEQGAVTWPGELGLAPDAMYDEIKRHGEWVLR